MEITLQKLQKKYDEMMAEYTALSIEFPAKDEEIKASADRIEGGYIKVTKNVAKTIATFRRRKADEAKAAAPEVEGVALDANRRREKIDTALKPKDDLTETSTPEDLDIWEKGIQVWYTANQMHLCTKAEQIQYVNSCIDVELQKKLQVNNTPKISLMFSTENKGRHFWDNILPDTGCCSSIFPRSFLSERLQKM